MNICINCGYSIKPIKKINKKIVCCCAGFIIIALFIALAVAFFGKKTTYPEMMKVLNCSYVSDAKEILGDDYEIMTSSTAKFYVYNDLELDGVVYETVYITERSDGSLYEIGFEFSVNDLKTVEKYAKDISKSYGNYTQNTNSYDWKTAKSLNPQIYIHGKESPYDITINLD